MTLPWSPDAVVDSMQSLGFFCSHHSRLLQEKRILAEIQSLQRQKEEATGTDIFLSGSSGWLGHRRKLGDLLFPSPHVLGTVDVFCIFWYDFAYHWLLLSGARWCWKSEPWLKVKVISWWASANAHSLVPTNPFSPGFHWKGSCHELYFEHCCDWTPSALLRYQI